MKLYLVRGCPFAHRAWISLREKRRAFEPVFFERGRRPPELEALGEHARSPTLVDGETAVWDSQVVLEYLEDLGAGPSLLPRDPAGRAAVRMYCARIGRELGALIGHAGVSVYGVPDDAVLADARRAMEVLAPYDAAIAGRPFVLGDTATLADVVLYTPLHALRRFWAIDLPPERAGLRAWRDRIEARDPTPYP